MNTERDFYAVLGVSRDADDKTIKSAFRNLALKYHPDRNKDPGAEEKFKEIAHAYAILHDPKKRAEYDARGHAGVAGLSPEDLFGGIDFEDIFGGLGFGFGGRGGGPFDSLFRRHRGPSRGANVEVEVVVPLETIASGGKETIHVGHPKTCPGCHGSGARKGTKPRQCEACEGTGRHVRREKRGNVSYQQITTCAACGGRGQFIDDPCPQCGGRGETRRKEAIAVTIPRGAEDGMILRVAGHGLPAPEPKAEAGDLLVVVRSASDPRFERHGANLWHAQRVEIADAVLGTDVVIPTLDGDLKVTVPPGTQPDSVLRLRGKGLPVYGGTRRGDILLRVEVHIPESPSAEERDLFKSLRALKSETAD